MFTLQRGLSLSSSSYVFWSKAGCSRKAVPFFPYQGKRIQERICRSSLLRRGIPEGLYPLPLFARECSPIMAGSVFPVVKHIAQVFSRVLGPFQASAFHPFIEPVVKILKSKKRIRISWEKKGGTKIYSHCFVEKAIASSVLSNVRKDKHNEKKHQEEWKDKPDGQDVFETNKFLTL